MITAEDYIILEKPTHIDELKEKLCIINFDIFSNYSYLKKLIKNNKNTTFWCATNVFSKEYVLKASKLGIQNVVQFPVKKEIIDAFFKDQQGSFHYSEPFFSEPLYDSDVLIVDDNEMNISLLNDMLTDIGARISSCFSPKDALMLIKNKKFSLILLDILMPDMSGFELAQLIRITGLNQNTPIIFISAISGDENMMNGYSLGACYYIEKPFSPMVVKAQIYNILKNEEFKLLSDKEKDSFVAGLTHDLKSPIDAEILALKQVLSDKSGNSEEILSELLNSAKYMKHITDKILCHYKQQSSEIVLNKELIDFNSLVFTCIEEMKYLASDKNIKISVSSPDEDVFINIDKIEIRRVINNLLANAIEYSYRDSYIDIKIEKSLHDIVFSIKDYGVGVDLNKYTRIFDEYMTLSKEQKKVGFGLGLNICKQIITAHNGTIDIVSETDKGTFINFTLPFCK